ncbi:MAG: YqiJ family protein [Propionibacteriaceae bacterium]|jgi:hypothetical protein|nr:YqiJ family protein [Propionibacteriaceae bacterium]
MTAALPPDPMARANDRLRWRRWWAQFRPRRGLTGRLIFLALLCLAIGALLGSLWYSLVDLPGYTLNNDFYAQMSEADQARIFQADLWLTVFGLVGLPLGWLVWRWFGQLGWPCVIIATLASLATGQVTAWIGHWLGPPPVDEILAVTQPASDVVIAVELTPHTEVYLAVWVALTLLPIVIAATTTTVSPRPWLQPQAPKAAYFAASPKPRHQLAASPGTDV